MSTVLLTFHIIIAFLMVLIILFQKNEGGGLGMGGGTMGGLMSARGTASLLTRTTGVLAALFFLSTLGLAIMFKGGQKSKSILDVPVSSVVQPSPQNPPLKKDPPSSPAPAPKVQ